MQESKSSGSFPPHSSSPETPQNRGTFPPGLRPSGEQQSAADEEDRAAIQRVLQGQQQAFRTLVEKYQRRIFNLALRYLGGQREREAEVAQEVFLKAYRGLAGFQQNARFSTWLHRIAVNHLISEIRRERAQKRGRPLSLDAPLRPERIETYLDTVGNHQDEPLRRLQNSENGETILREVGKLDESLRMVVVLRDLQGEPYEEIARELNLPVGTVRSRLHRAREILKEKLRSLL